MPYCLNWKWEPYEIDRQTDKQDVQCGRQKCHRNTYNISKYSAAIQPEYKTQQLTAKKTTDELPAWKTARLCQWCYLHSWDCELSLWMPQQTLSPETRLSPPSPNTTNTWNKACKENKAIKINLTEMFNCTNCTEQTNQQFSSILFVLNTSLQLRSHRQCLTWVINLALNGINDNMYVILGEGKFTQW